MLPSSRRTFGFGTVSFLSDRSPLRDLSPFLQSFSCPRTFLFENPTPNPT